MEKNIFFWCRSQCFFLGNQRCGNQFFHHCRLSAGQVYFVANPACWLLLFLLCRRACIHLKCRDWWNWYRRKVYIRDYMDIGTFAGPGRNINAEIQIGHYSNGNLFPQNPGVKVPLTFAVGYAFWKACSWISANEYSAVAVTPIYKINCFGTFR